MTQDALTTDTLELRPIAPQDAQAIFAYRSDSSTNRFQNFIPSKLEEVHDFIAEKAEDMNEIGACFQLVIIHSESAKIIGDIGLYFLDDAQVEVDITLAKAYHNKSYATEALTTIIDLLFKQVHKHRIIASTDPRNSSAIRLLERLGFRQEAHFIQSYYYQGEWLDDVQFGLLSSEWIE